jgi:hypothetical protein
MCSWNVLCLPRIAELFNLLTAQSDITRINLAKQSAKYVHQKNIV